MEKSVFVTGATGFIGTRLVGSLLDKNYSVISLIRSGKEAHPNSKVVLGDITDSNIKIPIDEVDCVFHLASNTPFEKNKKILEKVNLEGTKNLFLQVKDKTKSIIYISGIGVYGDPQENIVDESSPYNPNTEFAKIRIKAEKFLEEKCKQNGIGFSVIHLGHVYGPKGWFYDFLIKRMLKNSLRLPKNGDYYKCCVHIDDAVGGIIAVFEKSITGRFILVDSKPAKFREFVDFTADKFGAKHPGSIPTILAKAVLGGDMTKLLTTSMKASNLKISQIYDFKFPTFKEGIPQVISDIKLRKLLD